MLNPMEGHEPVSINASENQAANAYFKIEDIAVYLSIKTKTLYAMVEAGEIPHYRIGRLIRFKKGDVDSWMDAKKVMGGNPPCKPKRVFMSGMRSHYIDNVVRKTIDGLIG